MAILIELERRPYTSLEEEILTRREIGLLALDKYIRGYFTPDSLEIWDTAPLKELDGKCLFKDDINIGSVSELRKIIEENYNKYVKELATSIIRIYGNWNLNDQEHKGFISINHNPTWRTAYGDIDMDLIFGREDDITKLMWSDNEKNILVQKFIEDFLKDYKDQKLDAKLSLTWLCFASGIPYRRDITRIKAVYYNEQKQFVKDAFETYREKYDWVQRSLRLQYFVNRLYSHREFREDLKKKFEDFQISQIFENSVLLIGENLDSFLNLYEDFSKNYFYKIFKKFPSDETANSIITNVAVGQSDLDDYSTLTK